MKDGNDINGHFDCNFSINFTPLSFTHPSSKLTISFDNFDRYLTQLDDMTKMDPTHPRISYKKYILTNYNINY